MFNTLLERYEEAWSSLSWETTQWQSQALSPQKIDKSDGIAGVKLFRKKITLRFQALAFAKGTTKHRALTMDQLRHRVNTGKWKNNYQNLNNNTAICACDRYAGLQSAVLIHEIHVFHHNYIYKSLKAWLKFAFESSPWGSRRHQWTIIDAFISCYKDQGETLKTGYHKHLFDNNYQNPPCMRTNIAPLAFLTLLFIAMFVL